MSKNENRRVRTVVTRESECANQGGVRKKSGNADVASKATALSRVTCSSK